MPDLALHPASEYSLVQLNALFMEGFQDYFVPIPNNVTLFAQRIRSEHIDLQESLVVTVDGVPAGLSLTARRYNMTRLAGLCVSPAHRGLGLGQLLTEGFMKPGLERQDTLVLECFQANIKALQLYQKNGFEVTRSLVGYAGEVEPATHPELQPISLEAAVDFLRTHGDPDLPWQAHPDTLVSMPPTVKGYRLQDSVLLVSQAPEVLFLRTLVTAKDARKQGQATRLLQAVAAQTGIKRFQAVQIYPEVLLAPLAQKLGWQATDLPQFELVRKSQ